MIADELAGPHSVDLTSEHAVSMDADFTWEAIEKKSASKGQHNESDPSPASEAKADTPPSIASEEIFELKGMRLEVSKGSFVAIVGKIGSGKVRDSLLFGVDMYNDSLLELTCSSDAWRDAQDSWRSALPSIPVNSSTRCPSLKGIPQVTLGGLVAYVPQSPWIQNLTLRENITFGLPFHEERYVLEF